MTCLHINPPPRSLAISAPVFTSDHHLCSYHLLRLTHPLQQCKRIRLLHWNEADSTCEYRFYNQTDWSSNSRSATSHVNLDRLFSLCDPPFTYDNTHLANMMRNRWDRLYKAPTTCSACCLFSANASSPPAHPGLVAHWMFETWAPSSCPALPTASREMLRHHLTWTAPLRHSHQSWQLDHSQSQSSPTS